MFYFVVIKFILCYWYNQQTGIVFTNCSNFADDLIWTRPNSFVQNRRTDVESWPGFTYSSGFSVVAFEQVIAGGKGIFSEFEQILKHLRSCSHFLNKLWNKIITISAQWNCMKSFEVLGKWIRCVLFENGPRKICWRQPLKSLKWYSQLRQTVSLQISHKFYLVHSWISWPIYCYQNKSLSMHGKCWPLSIWC